MSKQFLHCANVIPGFEQMGGKRMPERMAGGVLRNARPAGPYIDGWVKYGLVQVVVSVAGETDATEELVLLLPG